MDEKHRGPGPDEILTQLTITLKRSHFPDEVTKRAPQLLSFAHPWRGSVMLSVSEQELHVMVQVIHKEPPRSLREGFKRLVVGLAEKLTNPEA